MLLRRLITPLLALLLAAAPLSDDPASSAISAVVARNASLHDYTFDVSVRVALLTFPWIRFSLAGHGQYLRDGAYVVHFDRVPWFGHGFETISMTSLDPKNWPAQYTIALAPPQNDNTILSMHDREHTALREALVTIDRDETVREIRWNYSNGHVRLSIAPLNVSGYALPQLEQADIVMPGYHATADASFSNYKVNLYPSPPPTASASR